MGKKFFIIGNNDDLLNDTQYIQCSNIFDSDFLLLITIANNSNKDKIKFYLDKGLENNKKLICVNPDKVGINGNSISLSVGSIAEEYEKNGGSVIYVGKPYFNSFQELKYNLLKF